MKRDSQESSSFDLFLDTICNTFGGIVFLAILLAILIQSRAVVKSAEQAEQSASPEKVRRLTAELDRLSSERETLVASLESLPEQTPDQDDQTYRQLADQLQSLKTDLEKRISSQRKASLRLAEVLEANAGQRKENEQVPTQLEGAEAELEEARAEYQGLVADKTQPLRLPKVRSAASSSILLLVKNQRLYLARDPGLEGRGFNADHVKTTTRWDTGIRVEPRSETGWRLTTSQGIQELKRIVQDARQRNDALTLAVWPDSYADFGELRELMISAGVYYRLWPQSLDEELVVYFGSGPSRVQ